MKKLPKGMSALKARILALFGDEAAAAEEAAELVAYNAMRTQMDGVGDQYKAASNLIDELIADEEENPTVTRGEEAAEETVEDARMTAIRMHCYSMIAGLQAVCNACSEQQMPEPSDPRYMEALDVHAASLNKTVDSLTMLEKAAALRTLIGKEISAKNKKVIQSAHDASHDMHTHTVALGAECSGMKALASKDCTTCDGDGTKDGKDCPDCNGTGQMKALKAACGCDQPTEAEMKTKAERIAALLANEHNATKTIDEKTSDDVLTVLEAAAESNKKHAVELKAAQEKQAQTDAALKAAQAAQIPAEELVTLRALGEERKLKDAAEKVELVTKLEALKTLSKVELEARSLDDLRTMAKFAKLPVVDFSLKGIPVPRAAEQTTSYAPVDSYGLKALQGKEEKAAV